MTVITPIHDIPGEIRETITQFLDLGQESGITNLQAIVAATGNAACLIAKQIGADQRRAYTAAARSITLIISSASQQIKQGEDEGSLCKAAEKIAKAVIELDPDKKILVIYKIAQCAVVSLRR